MDHVIELTLLVTPEQLLELRNDPAFIHKQLGLPCPKGPGTYGWSFERANLDAR